MHQLILHRRKLLAIAMAFLIWYVVVNLPNPATSGQSETFSLNVRHEFDLATQGGAVAVTWSSDSSRLAAVSSFGGLISVWDSSGRLINQIHRNGDGPAVDGSIAFVNGSSQLLFLPPAKAADSAALSIWDVETGAITGFVPGLEPERDYSLNRADHFMTSPDQNILAAGTRGGAKVGIHANVAIYDVKEWRITQSAMINSGVYSLSVFSNGRLLAIGSFGGSVTVIDTASGLKIHEFLAYDLSELGRVGIGAIAGSPDGNFLLTGAGIKTFSSTYTETAKAWSRTIESQSVQIFRISDEKRVAVLNAVAKSPIRQAAWDPKERFVAFVDNGGGLCLWQTMSFGSAYKRIDLPSQSLSLAISPNGHHIAVAGDRGVNVFSID